MQPVHWCARPQGICSRDCPNTDGLPRRGCDTDAARCLERHRGPEGSGHPSRDLKPPEPSPSVPLAALALAAVAGGAREPGRGPGAVSASQPAAQGRARSPALVLMG